MSILSVVGAWLFATLILVALAVGIVYMLAVSRRSPQDWQQHVKEQSETFADTPITRSSEVVEPRTVSLEGMLDARSEKGSAYYDPTRLPGYTHLEDATDRIEQRFKEK